jgi:dephospho-CoA kinase
MGLKETRGPFAFPQKSYRVENMLSVALTGGIGSGKSAVAEFFEELGAVVIDSDLLARDALERGTQGFDLTVARFGDEILAQGSIDRKKLASLIFHDPKAREELEAIIHPIVRRESSRITRRAKEDSIVINQIPLLFETKSADRFDLVITVESERELRIARLKERGLKEFEIAARLGAQATDDQRRSIANIVIENNGSLEDLRRRVEEVWSELLTQRSRQ